MQRAFLILVLGFALLSLRATCFADAYSDCTAVCDKTHASCLSVIHFVNEIENQDATLACNQAKDDCHDTCREKVENPQPEPKPEDGQQQ